MPYNTNPGYMQYPSLYQNSSYAQSQMPQVQYPQFTQTQQSMGITWVDGEVGAKAYQLPQNWPANTPIALWDTNDCVIYLKSVNQMGMPNPLQKIHYTMEETAQPVLIQGQSGTNANYVTKEDLNRMKEELMATISNGFSSRGNNYIRNDRNGGQKE